MKNEIQLINDAIEEWRIKKGIGTMYLPKNYNSHLILAIILSKLYSNGAATMINSLIIVPTFEERQKLIESITNSDDEEYNNKIKGFITSGLIKILTEDYINKKPYAYYTVFVACVNITSYNDSISCKLKKCKYKLVLLNHSLTTKDTSNLHIDCPALECFNSSDVIAARTSTPVEEIRIGVEIKDAKVVDEIKKRDDYIKTSITIFGSFDLIKEGFMGNSTMNFSAQQVCERLAYENGWNEHLDMSIELNRQIDKFYNPNSLKERASVTYNIIRERNQYLSDFEGKLEEILKIINEHEEERFLIISKRSEFASIITEYLNLHSVEQICANYHNKLNPIELLDDYGKPVLVKSGISKGKPRMIGAQAQCTRNLQLFKDGKLKALSTNSSPDKSLDIEITSIIITSPMCSTIEEYLYRLSDVVITNPTLKLYNLYCTNTIEEKKLNLQVGQNRKILNKNEQNVIFDENCGVIIC